MGSIYFATGGWDQLSEFIIPAILFFAYLLFSGKKKEKKQIPPPIDEEEEFIPRKEPLRQERRPPLAQSPIADRLIAPIEIDPSYALRKTKKSRAQRLLGGRSSLRKAFLMQVIFSPYQSKNR